MRAKRSLLLIWAIIILLLVGCGGQQLAKPEESKPVNPFSAENYRAQLLTYFKDVEKFDMKPDTGPNSSGQITSKGILKDRSGRQIEVSISEKNKLLDNVVLSIWLNRDNTSSNKDLIFISKLVGKMYPDFKGNMDFIKDGISNALQNKRSKTTKNDVDFQFVYIQDAGGTKGENAILFGIEKTKSISVSGSKIEVDFSIESKIDNGKIQFIGKTNLPNGMELMVSLGNPTTRFFAQDKVKINNGTFTTAPFSNKGAALPSGTYNLSIQAPLAAVQSQNIREIIGQHGEKLAGPFVKYDEKYNDNTVFFKQAVTIK